MSQNLSLPYPSVHLPRSLKLLGMVMAAEVSKYIFLFCYGILNDEGSSEL